MEQIDLGRVVDRPERHIQVRPMTALDAEAVLQIYQVGIESGHATFVSAAPDWASWDRGHLPHSRLVAATGAQVVAWTALSPVSPRPVYRGVAEISIYVAPAAQGRGLGRQLLRNTIAASEAAGIWTLLAGIFPENPASLALHEACGFRIIGVQERAGRMEHGPLAGRWRDVVRMERRSAVVGQE